MHPYSQKKRKKKKNRDKSDVLEIYIFLWKGKIIDMLNKSH